MIEFMFLLIWLSIVGIMALIPMIQNLVPEEKRQKKLIEKLEYILNQQKNEKAFNRQNYGEAFADNFARMYGYGPQLISGLHKMKINLDKQVKSWYKKESEREICIFNMTTSMLKDVHKTNIHRIKSLLDEYDQDLKDPNIPEEVKKMMEQDVKELKIILHQYLNNMSSFQNKVNNAIADSLNLIDDISDDEIKQESVENYMTESKKAYEKMMKEINSITSSERTEFYKLFGHSKACSLAKDKDGYYVRTHRARSKSYKEIKDIPEKDVKFVRSTA